MPRSFAAAGSAAVAALLLAVVLLAGAASAAETMDGIRVRVEVPDAVAGVLATVKRNGVPTSHTLQFEVSEVAEFEVPVGLGDTPVAVYDVRPPTASFALTRSEQENRTRVDSVASVTAAAPAPANAFRTRVELIRDGGFTFDYGGARYTLANDTIKVSLATASWQYASTSGTSQLLLRILARSSVDLDFAGASKVNLTPDFYRYCLPPANKSEATLCVELFRPVFVDDIKINLASVPAALGGEVVPIDERSAFLQYLLPHGSKIYWDPNVVVLFPDGYDSGGGGGRPSDDSSDSKGGGSSAARRLGIGLGVGLGGGLLLILACLFVVVVIAAILLSATVGPGVYATLSARTRAASRRRSAAADPLHGSASAAELVGGSPLGSNDSTAV